VSVTEDAERSGVQLEMATVLDRQVDPAQRQRAQELPAVISKGAGGRYDTTTLGKPILGFVFGEKGLIGDLSLEGTKITKIKTTD
jgi:hypothetical protein